MSSRLHVRAEMEVGLERVWDELVDWQGQERWIPLTTVRVLSAHEEGLGVRVVALSGWWLNRLPLGLLDNFVVTGWSPPLDGRAELEVLHLGPWFTGEGVFRLSGDASRTTVHATEVFDLPGGALTNRLVRPALPLMRRGFRLSLKQLAAVAQRPARARTP